MTYFLYLSDRIHTLFNFPSRGNHPPIVIIIKNKYDLIAYEGKSHVDTIRNPYQQSDLNKTLRVHGTIVITSKHADLLLDNIGNR